LAARQGKGKVVDILARDSDMVVRYGGGSNAGHTVVIGNERFALHLLPSGSIRAGVACVIANAVVVDPAVLIGEIDGLAERGIELDGRLFISENAHVVLDYHKREDQLREESLGKKKLGTTVRGIGPCYADKVGRSYAVRMGDFRDLDALREKLIAIVAYKNKLFGALYQAEPMSVESILDSCVSYAERLVPFTVDTTELLHDAIGQGKSILFEGAQGALLDLDHGTFPYVTSSNSSALGLPAGSGVPAMKVDKYIGVVKAYTTRVGAGPFPTEQDNEIGQYIRDEGNEYGTTTGRPRRCGWFDAVAVMYGVTIGAVNALALMHDASGYTDGAQGAERLSRVQDRRPGEDVFPGQHRPTGQGPAGLRDARRLGRGYHRGNELRRVAGRGPGLRAARRRDRRRPNRNGGRRTETSDSQWRRTAGGVESVAMDSFEERIRATAERLGIEPEQVPRHIAVIMDGNGRWAKKKGLPRYEGHWEGARTAKAVAMHCVEIGVRSLALYSFSMENWKRPQEEVNALMHLYREYLVYIRPTLMKENVRLVHLGRMAGLPEAVRDELNNTMAITADNTGMVLALALNYGGRAEIGIADPDLLIRTASEMRVSNFLLWQISYSEFHVTSTLWPDFTAESLDEAVLAYARRDRRFGAIDVGPQASK
jgi:adenylosuccinate synthase